MVQLANASAKLKLFLFYIFSSPQYRIPLLPQLHIMASPVASAALKARIRRPSLLKKLTRPEDLMHHFPNGSYIGWSGFTGVGYPSELSRSFGVVSC
jgi:hypothetical protein